MRRLLYMIFGAALLLGPITPKAADNVVLEDFTMQPETRWDFFTDQVMGGKSTGQVVFLQDAGEPFARMTGQVSTANRGGFIQMRQELTSAPPDGTIGIRLLVRGNGQRYFVHLRTSGTILPWQFYQAGFEASGTWQEVRLPLEAFKTSGLLLRKIPRVQSVTSVAIAAYGREHEAQVDVREVGFY